MIEERFKAFLWNQINGTIADVREAGSSEEVDRGLDKLGEFLDELKSVYELKMEG